MARRSGHGRRRRLPQAEGALTLLVLGGAWELAVGAGAADLAFLPAPSGVAGGLVAVVASGELGPRTAHTLRTTLGGWAVGSAAGILLGVALGLSPRAWRWSMASIEVVRAVPPVALAPVALLAFGFSVRMELTLVVFVVAWTVLVSAADGVRGVGPDRLDLARSLRLSRRATVAKVVAPAAAGAIVVGLRLALSLALVLAVVAEMVGNPRGLGNALVRAQHALQPEQLFAYVLVIGVLGVALNAALGWLVGRLLPGSTPEGGRL